MLSTRAHLNLGSMALAGRAARQRTSPASWTRNGSLRAKSSTTTTSSSTSSASSTPPHLKPAATQAAKHHTATHLPTPSIADLAATTLGAVPASAPSAVLQALRRPMRFYTEANTRRPYLTQILSTIVAYILGDAVAQYIQSSGFIAPPPTIPSSEDESSSSAKEQYDTARTVRATIIGALSAVPAYLWFTNLGKLRLPTPAFLPARLVFPVHLATKVLLNQFTFAPLFNSYFFSMQSMLGGVMAPGGMHRLMTAPGEIFGDAVDRVQRTLFDSWTNSWKFWPAVQAFNLTYVPHHSRSLFAAGMGIVWQTYLSILNQHAAQAQLVESVEVEPELKPTASSS